MAGEVRLKCGLSVRLNRCRYARCQWGCALRGERVACFELSDRHLNGERASAPADNPLRVRSPAVRIQQLWRLPFGSLNRWCLGAVEQEKNLPDGGGGEPVESAKTGVVLT
jgi:hypothetical protein